MQKQVSKRPPSAQKALEWYYMSKRFIEVAHKVMGDKPIYATLALPKDFLVQSEATIEPVLQEILDLKVEGYYVIAEALDRKYLIDNPLWLSNVLHISEPLEIYSDTV